MTEERSTEENGALKAASYSISDLNEGFTFEFDRVFSVEDIDSFVEVSGDCSPLHVDGPFAESRGFSGRVVHGALVSSLASRMVGVHLPGRNALLQSMSMRYHAPVYPGEQLHVKGVVDQLSESTGTVVVKVEVTGGVGGELKAKGKVQVGFTVEN